MEDRRIRKNPIKYILRGFFAKKDNGQQWRRPELKVQRGPDTNIDIRFLDGYMLSGLDVGARLRTREDVAELIYFLKVHERCLKYRNGTHLPDTKQ